MTGFRTDVFRPLLAVLALAALVSPAFAQATDSVPGTAPAVTVGGTLPPPGRTATSGVQVGSLGSVEAPVGLLDSTNGGLAEGIWENTSRSRAEELLNRVPLASASPSVHALARRLVLTTAEAPAGDAGHAFLSVRLRTLLDAGLVADAGALAAKATPSRDAELSRIIADALLLSGRSNDACGQATSLRLDSAEAFWIRLRAFCYAAAGDSGALDLTRGVLQAQNVDNRGFETLLANYGGPRRTPESFRIDNPSSLDVFLLKAEGQPVDPSWSQRLGMPANAIALRDAADSPDQRFEAAEELCRTGAMSAGELGQVADGATFSPDQINAAATIAPTLSFLAGQALLRQAAHHASDAEARKVLLLQALRLGATRNLLAVSAQLQGSAASAIVPQRTDRGVADMMASALMLSGHAEAAARWYDILDLNSDTDRPLIHKLQIELNVVASNPARAFEAQGALQWFAEQSRAPAPIGGGQTLAFAALALGSYAALGLPLPAGADPANQQESFSGRTAPAALLKDLADAESDNGRRGDAILAMLDFIGADGPGDLSPETTVAFVKALARMGYTDAARDLAVDSMLLRPDGVRSPGSASAS